MIHHNIHWKCSILLLLRSIFFAASAFAFFSPLQQNVYSVNSRKLQLNQHNVKNKKNGDGDDVDIDSVGLYVHIPYCRRRCNYCNFAITPVGSAKVENNEGFHKIDTRYKNALLDEIDAVKHSSSSHHHHPIRLRSIYFGGGTPSLAPASTLRGIIDKIYELFSISEDAEITIEMDPGTFDLSYLTVVKEMGFNRISLGVQSFNDNLLKTMGRVHCVADVYESIDMIRQVYGEDANYSIDLISGAPGLTLAEWTDTLSKAVRLHPRPMHVSVYDLQIEGGTAFGKWYKTSENVEEASYVAAPIIDKVSIHPALPSAEDCAFMYSYASGYLKSKKYSHYEISSYAYTTSDGKEHRSRHNQIYWEYHGQWYALGMGSTSNINGVRFKRPRAFSDYISWATDLKRGQIHEEQLSPWLYKYPIDENKQHENHVENLLDVVMTRLRTSEGLDLDWVANHDNYNNEHVNLILRGFELASDLGLGHRIASRSGAYGCIKLSDPRGFLFSNNIISNIFLSLTDSN